MLIEFEPSRAVSQLVKHKRSFVLYSYLNLIGYNHKSVVTLYLTETVLFFPCCQYHDLFELGFILSKPNMLFYCLQSPLVVYSQASLYNKHLSL